MKKNLFAMLFSLILLFSLLVGNVFAGGGRMMLYTTDTSNNYYYVGREMYVLAQVWKPDTSNNTFSVGERVEFRIDNPRAGDKCVTIKTVTNEMGLTNAACSATEPGTISVYLHSLDDGYDSSRFLLHFYPMPTKTPAPPTKTPVPPTKAVVPTSVLRPSSSPTTVILNSDDTDIGKNADGKDDDANDLTSSDSSAKNPSYDLDAGIDEQIENDRQKMIWVMVGLSGLVIISVVSLLAVRRR